MVLWGVSQLLVAHGIIVGFVSLSHLGRGHDERLTRFRFGLVLVAALPLSVLAFVGLPVEIGDPEATSITIREILVVGVLVSAWGAFFGSIGVVLYAIAGGLPDATAAR